MQYALTFADVQSVKRLAKQLKQAYPELPHGKRLDLAAADLLGLRNYHELNRRFQVVIDQYLDSPSGPNAVAHCLYCDFRFAADLKDDQREHREIHERIMEVHEITGYRPGTYVERETLKKDGYTKARGAGPLEDRIEGALLVLRGWFDRSYRSAIEAGQWRKHPSFEVYVAMMVPYIEELFPELAPSLAQRYGRTPGVIAHGQTNWPLR
ncbi:hypothetical protein [Pseudomonas chlororaphis]|uniref:hypothetical protein n=1 Tax=Pseudomonas chlororaphis TaxID=587753 RepID=UPI000F58367B|nr:hypothetical protein [Pseudomonas chlororaphis]AZC70564.1 hypothetical protein C4K32_3906 [Pseudomonas chlororaphis subsp. piscium]